MIPMWILLFFNLDRIAWRGAGVPLQEGKVAARPPSTTQPNTGRGGIAAWAGSRAASRLSPGGPIATF